jgi:glycosyltransferase involved in cell wall biosynthesis
LKLSVIIPCLNEAAHIAVQLEALANQEWDQPWEVLVCDNGSTDPTVSLAQQYQTRLPRLAIVDASARPGQAHARNVGAQVARGELLAFCDADDEVGPGWVAAIGTALAQHDCVASRFEPGKLNAPWLLNSRACPQQSNLQQYTYPPYLAHASSSGLGIKRACHEAIGGFDETMRFLEDTDYCWRLQLAGVNLHFVSDAVIHYRFRDRLDEIYWQAYRYAKYNVLLYKKYRPQGMPPLQVSWQAEARAWWQLLRRLPRLQQPAKRARWARELGRRMGRLSGSIAYRTLAL